MPAGPAVDLTNCDREPIHLPGGIQPHGLLFALREPELVVIQASANAGDVLEQTFDMLVDPTQKADCRAWLNGSDFTDSLPLRFGPSQAPYVASAHRHDGVLIVELEPVGESPPDASRSARLAMGRLQAAGSFREFCQIAVAEVRALNGFDRVFVLRFEGDGRGTVIAEDRRPDLQPLLGLLYPASDIPAQARQLYLANRVRLIGDSHAVPVPLLPAGHTLDLSMASLRAVSPVHQQYLRNMGVRTSLSLALVRDGTLWGLMTSHQVDAPRIPSPAMRDACAFLGTLVSLQLAAQEARAGYEFRRRALVTHDRLLHNMAEQPDLGRALACDDLLTLTGATGAAIVTNLSCTLVGVTPGEATVQRWLAWLKQRSVSEPLHTDRLSKWLPDAHAHLVTAAGLLATSVGTGCWILWFRPEVVRTIHWGGDPTKPVAPVGGFPGPRTSFAPWTETVWETSAPWQPWELDAARTLRDAIVAIVVRRADELLRLNAQLERSNSELDAFAFITSHDLKEPLRGIHNYSTFLMEDYADKLDAEGVNKLRTLAQLSQRMEDLVESLLQYSRLGRMALALAPTDLNEVVGEVRELLGMILSERGAEVALPRPLPTVACDRIQVTQLYNNLITNAVKYNDKPIKRVELGYDDSSGEMRLFVRDNGIGIADKHHQAIFRMFKRLHGRDKFGGGTGAGLAFAKKIVERHGGRVWVESMPDDGSTFWFTLGAAP